MLGYYLIDPNYIKTKEKIEYVGKQTTQDFMLSSLNVTDIAQDNQKLIWIGTSAGINVYNGKDYLQFFHDSKDTTALPDDYINVLHRDKQGKMWVGTQNGVARYEGGYRFHRFVLPGHIDNITQITEAPLSTAQNPMVIVGNGRKNYLISSQSIHPYPRTVSNPSKDNERSQNINAISKIPNLLQKPKELISCVFKDAGGNLFVGFHNAGFQVISQNMLLFNQANENPLVQFSKGKDIISLATIDNQILAGTTLRLYIYDHKTKKCHKVFYKDIFHCADSNLQELITLIPLGKKQVCLIGKHEIISSKVADGKMNPEHQVTHLPILGMGCKSGDNIYISCNAPYLIRYKYAEKQIDSIAIKNKWYDEETQLTTLRDGNILLFMKNMHIALLQPRTGKIYEIPLNHSTEQGNIDPAFVRQDTNGSIWLGTKRSGLYRLSDNKQKVERMNFVSDVHIQGMLEDKQGQIWITTLKDAICYQPSTGTVLMNSLVSSSQNEWNRQYFDNSICLAPNGNIILGSSDGCIFLPPASGNKDRIANKKTLANKQVPYDNSTTLEKGLCIYAINIQDADGVKKTINHYLDNSNLHTSLYKKAEVQHYTFNHKENNLTFSFFYPNFSRRSSLQYQYMLEGYDKQWREPTYEHDAHFSNLSPGTYTFKLRLISSPNQPALAERTIQITIKPSIWSSPAAWLLYISIIAFLIYYINSLYLRIRSNRLLLQQEQHEREREQHVNEMNMSFFANISHEFRNPITIIAGPLLALKSNENLPAQVHQTLNRVCMSVNRMLRLIDQMLDFNQLETDALRLKVCETNIAQELHDLVTTFEESTLVRGINLETSIPTEPLCVWLDADKFEKILSNLFTNALKHTSDKGVIKINAHLEQETRQLVVSVYNSGSPIAEERLQDVFKRYYQLSDTQATHHYGWGTGIGLYYVKRLVGLHHGRIFVKNVSSIDATSTKEGVEFTFQLPAYKEAYQESERNQINARVMQIPTELPSQLSHLQEASNLIVSQNGQEDTTEKKKIKILIVDDDIDVAQYIRSIFTADYIVENRYSAEDALEDMEQIAPDIILSDIIMGKMSGYEFCKTLKADLMFSHIPVILITAKSNMSEQIDGLRLGAAAYVTKPFDPTYLRALVESQLNNLQTLRKRLGESTETEALGATVANTLSGQDKKFMDELYSLMEKRAAEYDLNVATVCHDLLISQSKFTYKLKELTGDTPGVFFRKYKLNKAAHLLKEGKYNISEIASLVGFNTAAHFSVAFKKQFGVSPSDY